MSSPESRGDGPASPRPIRVLPDTLVDQIAAGEVVERPASVVKELVENALDAGARRLGVEVREGGAALVAVVDDGWGMGAEDARVALRRHATSKLARAEDLARIGTYGFRGEALPAIASVSRLRLRTRLAAAAAAFEVQLEAGRVVTEREVGGPPGTRVEVADLFAGVPARRKFLKKPTTEWGHVSDWLARAALANPGVHFDLRRDDRPAVAWPATPEPVDRIAAVLSDDVAAAMVAVEGADGALRIHGYATRPDAHRPNAAGIYLFVNGRPVRDRLLRHALLEVYRDWLPRGRFPSAVLFVDLPSEAVDVNVHPAKWEVRFVDPGAVHRLVRRSVRDAVARRAWLAGAGAGAVAGREATGGAPVPSRPVTPGRAAPGAGARSDWVFAGDTAATDRVGEPPPAPAEASGPGPAGEPVRFGELRCIGQLFATYLLLEAKEALLLVDQHTAHERILYERLRAQRLGGGVERQALLLTTTVELAPAACEALCAARERALALGFEIEPFGENTVAVRALPALVAGRDPGGLVRGLADELEQAERVGGESDAGSRSVEPLDRVLATMACHSARRAGERLPPEEQRALLDALDTIPWAPTCPHGRPVAVPLTLADVERRFARR